MDIDTVQDRGREGTPDSELLLDALRDERIMLTNDTDFLALAAAHAARKETFAPIFFWPQNRRRIGDVVRSTIRLATTLEYAEARSRVHFL
jgi:predicted nuclease of predicted toxin-antitoxin system